MATLWWILANTLLPIFLPLLVLWPWRLAKRNKRYDEQLEKNTSFGAAGKNGQFCLVAIALCVSSLHEVLVSPGPLRDWVVGVAVLQGALAAGALLIYTLAMAFDTEVDLSKSGWAWFRYYIWATGSFAACALAGAAAIANHIGLAGKG